MNFTGNRKKQVFYLAICLEELRKTIKSQSPGSDLTLGLPKHKVGVQSESELLCN
jgi:hypothetical protein